VRCLRLRSLVSAVLLCLGSPLPTATAASDGPRVATFCCDITPPLGQPMISCDLLRTVERPLLAKGIVLDADGQRCVLCALDWCLLCNGAYDAMRNRIAAAAGADPAHVAVQTVHQHTAPLVDMDAQKLLAEVGAPGLQLDPKVFDAIGQRLASAIKQSLGKIEPFDRIGTGQAKVDRVASSRRPVDATGKIRPRMSNCNDPAVRALPEGTIDPYLKTITLARGDKPLVRLHYYATHPQTRYGDCRASSDIVGEAREELERTEHVFQIYFNGCGGDITVGKYNDGSKQCREELAGRLLAGMKASVAAMRLVPVGPVCWRTYSLVLPRRTDAGFSLAESLSCMTSPTKHGGERVYRGAAQVAFHRRSGQPIELSSLEIGDVHVVHLPGEPMVAFQLYAQSLKSGAFVAVAGYGDGGPGYLCPEHAYADGGYEPTASRVKPESENLVKKALAELLGIERAVDQDRPLLPPCGLREGVQ
jgi:hypothetical protein